MRVQLSKRAVLVDDPPPPPQLREMLAVVVVISRSSSSCCCFESARLDPSGGRLDWMIGSAPDGGYGYVSGRLDGKAHRLMLWLAAAAAAAPARG